MQICGCLLFDFVGERFDEIGTGERVDDGPIEFDTTYEDALEETRTEARYTLDAPAGAIIAIGAVAGAAIGARILHLIPAHLLRRVFSAVLVIVAVRMVIG